MRIELKSPLKLNEIKNATGGYCPKELNEVAITHITTDTRELYKGDLFIALRGDKEDGELYCDKAISCGAYTVSRRTHEKGIEVADTSEALLKIAGYYKKERLRNLKFTVGVTGSIGKTTTKNYLYNILKTKFKSFRNEGNYNNLVGMPLTILSCPVDKEVLILEMGMNRRHEIEKMSRVAEPDIGIITSISTSHIGNLGSKEEIAEAKLEILSGMKNGLLLTDYDEPLFKHIKDKYTLSLESYMANCYLRPIKSNFYGSIFDLYPDGECIENLYCEIGAPHNLKNLGYALYAFYLMGATKEEIKAALPHISANDGRYRLIRLGGLTVYDDSYNSSPESVIGAIKHIKLTSKEFSAVIGDILELGDMSESIHRSLGKEVVQLGIKRLYCFGKYSKFLKEGALGAGLKENDIYLNEDTDAPEITVRQILSSIKSDEVLLIKASHALKAYRISENLKKELKK